MVYQRRLNRTLLDKFLKPEHRAAGMHLVENYPDGVTLTCPDQEPIQFTDHAQIEYIQHEADQIVNSMKSGITFGEREIWIQV